MEEATIEKEPIVPAPFGTVQTGFHDGATSTILPGMRCVRCVRLALGYAAPADSLRQLPDTLQGPGCL